MSKLMSSIAEDSDSSTAFGVADNHTELRDAQTGRSALAVEQERSDKINVLFVIDAIANPNAGSEQHLLFLLKRLPTDVFRVHFALLGAMRPEYLRLFPVEPIVLGGRSRFRPWNTLQYLWRLARVIKSLRIDVVHAFFQGSETAALLATRLARRGRVLGVRRNMGYWHTRRTLWEARLMRLFRADYAANCEAAKDFAVQEEWVPASRFTVIRNPLPTKRLEDGLRNVVSAESLGIRDGEQVVGIVAMLRPVKDHTTFLYAAGLVLDRFPETRFLAVGHQLPDDFASLRSLASELGIEEQVSWVGSVENPMTVLPHCDVGVLSSRSEGLSNALVEYAGAGIPAVATDVGGNAEVVEEGRTGFLVPPGSPDAMADRICRLLGDRMLRKSFGENARLRAQSLFSEQKVLDEYEKLYSGLSGHRDNEQTKQGALPEPV